MTVLRCGFSLQNRRKLLAAALVRTVPSFASGVTGKTQDGIPTSGGN
ncbi:MAG: hypothetical protein KDA96_17020 [Planctomycetaceae bacterium]|nr:hypothetical protein [Planctomycetaceae bacterium]